MLFYILSQLGSILITPWQHPPRLGMLFSILSRPKPSTLNPTKALLPGLSIIIIIIIFMQFNATAAG